MNKLQVILEAVNGEIIEVNTGYVSYKDSDDEVKKMPTDKVLLKAILKELQELHEEYLDWDKTFREEGHANERLPRKIGYIKDLIIQTQATMISLLEEV